MVTICSLIPLSEWLAGLVSEIFVGWVIVGIISLFKLFIYFLYRFFLYYVIYIVFVWGVRMMRGIITGTDDPFKRALRRPTQTRIGIPE